MSGDTSQRMQQLLRDSRLWIFAVLTTLLLTLIFSVNLVFGSEVSVTVGERASEDVFAPYSTSYISDVLTRQAREQAAAGVQDIYTGLDLGLLRSQLALAQNVFNYIDVVRADTLADEQTKARYLAATEVLELSPELIDEILAFSPNEWSAVKADILRIVDDVSRSEIRDTSGALEAARSSVRTRISIDLNAAQEEVVTDLAAQLIVPNSFLDEEATAARREEVAAAVQEQRVTLTEGQRILRVGETVTPEHVEQLSRLGLMQQQTGWQDVLPIFVASLLSLGAIAFYSQRFQPATKNSVRHLTILGVLLVLFAAAGKALFATPGPIVYLFPAAALSMLLATIFDIRFAAFVTVALALLYAYTSQQALEVAMYASAGPVFAVLMLRDAGRINAFFRAGVVVAVINMVVILLFRFPFPVTADSVALLTPLLFGLVNGVLVSAGVTLAGFYILGGVAGVLTILQLQELSRLDHPLLKELLRRAPGTYHHSIMVANLAEQAAERVHADSSLVRVGAFYHDIGKMNRPPFFTENQEGVNPHDTLDPHISARIIIGHVSDGLALAQKYRLPKRIQDFIAEHHGDRVVYAFYRKAVEQAGGDEGEVERRRFRYKGPRPRTRESGVVLLADSVDATSTALRPNTEEAIVKLVNKIVDDHVQDGQLDNSGLTLGDVTEIKASFVETLKGRFHVRVRYPGNEEIEAPAAARAPALPAPGDGQGVSEPVAPPVPVSNPILPRPSQQESR